MVTDLRKGICQTVPRDAERRLLLAPLHSSSVADSWHTAARFLFDAACRFPHYQCGGTVAARAACKRHGHAGLCTRHRPRPHKRQRPRDPQVCTHHAVATCPDTTVRTAPRSRSCFAWRHARAVSVAAVSLTMAAKMRELECDEMPSGTSSAGIGELCIMVWSLILVSPSCSPCRLSCSVSVLRCGWPAKPLGPPSLLLSSMPRYENIAWHPCRQACPADFPVPACSRAFVWRVHDLPAVLPVAVLGSGAWSWQS